MCDSGQTVGTASRQATSAGFSPGTVRGVLLAVSAVLGVVCAVIHFAVAGEHYAEFWGFGVFMLGVAWLQLIWAVGLIGWPTRVWLGLGALLNAIIVVVYVITRTVGDVIGPTPTDVEPVGFGDAFCTACEVAAVALAVLLLARRLHRPVPRPAAVRTITMVAAAAMVLLSIALVAGGPEMVMSGG